MHWTARDALVRDDYTIYPCVGKDCDGTFVEESGPVAEAIKTAEEHRRDAIRFTHHALDYHGA
jgi:hypothetical protein